MVDSLNKSLRGRSRVRNRNDATTQASVDTEVGLKGRLRRFSRSIVNRSRSSSMTQNIRKVINEQESKQSSKSTSELTVETPTGDILKDLYRQEKSLKDVEKLSVIQECHSDDELQSRDESAGTKLDEEQLRDTGTSSMFCIACCGF